ncbi:hypothetical protein BaRGS_00034013 [Batillaria attramentaria]|uniref:G-protein coupled receptors family 1 profile domain-containing protein n=1 Tax=Batillaria attramentaria TaxID=370345 RepID=A0ABD0JJ33_9CAEN
MSLSETDILPGLNASVVAGVGSMNKSEASMTYTNFSYDDLLALNQTMNDNCDKAGTTIMSLGIVGNVFVLWVWQADSSFNPSTFFIKYLATCNLLFQVSSLSGLIDLRVGILAGYLFSVMSAHVTLALAVSRCVAVYRPLRVHLILSRRRVIVVSVVIACWCLLLGGSLVVMSICVVSDIICPRFFGKAVGGVLMLILVFLSYFLPLLLMAACNVALLVKVCRRDVTSSISNDQARASRQRTRRLTLGVVCITTTSLLAYPVNLSVVFTTTLHYPADPLVAATVGCVGNLLLATDASVNVIYYVIFASEFRRLLVLRFTRLWGCCSRR